MSDGTPCADTDYCNGVETCVGGVCVAAASTPDAGECAPDAAVADAGDLDGAVVAVDTGVAEPLDAGPTDVGTLEPPDPPDAAKPVTKVDAGDITVANGGCGCAAGGSGLMGLAGLVLALAFLPRRRR